ncbi:MAG TPA: DUF4411 family protein [Longimicrobium sp.]|nr:DUF4411 family protein [Longimicrobium sp.]
MLYVFDTNSIRVLGNYYPERFPTFWRRFDEAVQQGRVVSAREVLNELEKQSVAPWLLQWVREHRSSFLLPDAVETDFITQIFRVPHFQTLIGEMQRLRGYPVADPFVVACARVRGGCVVTEESARPNAAKIPNVCDHFGVRCTNVEGFLREIGWEF